MKPPIWRQYVTTLCTEVWHLDGPVTEEVITRIEDLLAVGELTDSAVSEVLTGVGVSERSVDLIAASIRAAIRA